MSFISTLISWDGNIVYDECSLFKNSFVYSLRAFFIGW